MPKLWEKTGNAKDSSDLQQVDLSTLAITQPTVIYIAGWPVNDKNTGEVSKSINFVKEILAGRPELKSMPQVYSWSHKGMLSAIFNIIPYNCFPQRRCTSAARALAQGAIMPLVSKEGRRLSPEKARKNLRNLTFLNICAGSIVVQEVFNASLKMMKDIGYKPEEARELLREVANIAMAPVSVPLKEQNRFSTLTLINSDDVVVRFLNRVLHPLRSIFSRKARRPLKIKSLSGASSLVTGAARRKMWVQDWHKTPKEVIEGVRLTRWHLAFKGLPFPNFNHETPYYLNYDDQTSQMSRIVPTALVNAVTRTTTNPVELVKPLRDAPAHYRGKIKQALAS